MDTSDKLFEILKQYGDEAGLYKASAVDLLKMRIEIVKISVLENIAGKLMQISEKIEGI